MFINVTKTDRTKKSESDLHGTDYVYHKLGKYSDIFLLIGHL